MQPSVVCFLFGFVTASDTGPVPTARHECDVVIAGGSLASAAAAVTAGNASNETSVCFIEITDWPGGQASASGIPAMDFGLQYLNFPENIPQSLAELLTDGKMGGPRYNPGECEYLPKCFAPDWVSTWVLHRLAELPNVAVFLNTTVVKVDSDATTGRVTGLHAVQRTPTALHPSGWDRPLSEALSDWYSPIPSSYFNKTQLHFVVAPTGVVVEATEFGDVLVLTDGIPVAQGVELEAENSTEYEEHCGNPAAFTVFAKWDTAPQQPFGNTKGNTAPQSLAPQQPFGNTNRSLPGWLKVRRFWTMARHTPRSYDPYHSHNSHNLIPQLAPGDHYPVTSDCNEVFDGHVFLPLETARATARGGAWAGGMNVTAIAMAEAQAWVCYHEVQNGSLSTCPEDSGTSDGLAKMPYLREARRSGAGVGAFRLCHNIMSANNTGPGGKGCSTAADPPSTHAHSGLGYRFHDTVAIGSPQPMFGYDVHVHHTCKYPRYIRNTVRIPNSTVPFFIPFRALTVAGAPNLLVAGKSMATSFLTQSVTRLHPNEWASGTAAGAAAVVMSVFNLSSAQMATNVSKVQNLLRLMGAPLTFNFTQPVVDKH